MAAGMMRMFGGSTRTQLMVLGVILVVLGMVGAFGVMFFPNEDPASIIENPAKDKYYNAVALWAMIALFIVAIVGILLIGTAYTGLPFVHMARYHVGIFYVSVFSLTLLPTAIALRMGAQLVSNATFETRFAEGLVDHGFTSPAGWFALGIGIAVMAISLLIIVMNLLSLAKVSYKPSLVRGGAIMGVALVAMFIVTLMASPFLAALQFDHEVGRVGAEGFGEFQPQDITLSQSWVKWLAKAEYSSTYGTLSFWLTMMAWFVYIGLAVAIVGFIGLALYSANDRKPVVPQLILMPIGSMALGFLALLTYLFYNAGIDKISERLSVSSDITEIAYGGGNMTIALAMVFFAIALAIAYAVSIREWLQAMFKGQRVVDPISMNSMVDPPTNLPPPPTGWPARWERMSNLNYAVIAVVVIVCTLTGDAPPTGTSPT